MNAKTKPKTTGASTTVLAPQKEHEKEHVFSINTTKKGAQVRLVNNAPQQEQEIRRVRAD
jgi:hypothetical protein